MPLVMLQPAHRLSHAVASAVIIAACTLAAQSAPLDEALRRIFERNEFAAESLGPTAWLDDGRRYTAVRRGTGDLVAHDTASGSEQVLVPARALVPAGAKDPLEIDEY